MNKRIFQRIHFLFLSGVFFLTSCASHFTIVKRKYEPGYYVEYSQKKLPSSIANEKPKVVNYVAEKNDEEIKNEANNVLASNSESISEKENLQNSYNKKPILLHNHLSDKIKFQYLYSDSTSVNQKKIEKQTPRKILVDGWWRRHFGTICLFFIGIVTLVLIIIFRVDVLL
jgi:hypothetical protein